MKVIVGFKVPNLDFFAVEKIPYLDEFRTIICRLYGKPQSKDRGHIMFYNKICDKINDTEIPNDGKYPSIITSEIQIINPNHDLDRFLQVLNDFLGSGNFHIYYPMYQDNTPEILSIQVLLIFDHYEYSRIFKTASVLHVIFGANLIEDNTNPCFIVKPITIESLYK